MPSGHTKFTVLEGSRAESNANFSLPVVPHSIYDDDINCTPAYQLKSTILFDYLLHFQGCIWVQTVQNIFVECTIKCSKALTTCINCILKSLWKQSKPIKSQQFSTIGAFTLLTSRFLKSRHFDPTIYTCAKNRKVSVSRNFAIFWLVVRMCDHRLQCMHSCSMHEGRGYRYTFQRARVASSRKYPRSRDEKSRHFSVTIYTG